MSTAEANNKHIDQLHFEHRLWASRCSFYADELEIFQWRLDEIAAQNSSTDMRKTIAHFQNQFIIHKEQIDILSHNTNKHEQVLGHYAQQHPVAVDHVRFADHELLRDQQETFTKLFNKLKADFMRFLYETL